MSSDLSSVEALTRQFYEWENRGRGWQVWGRPVALEPPFRPFFGHFISGPPVAGADDGRRSTAFSSVFSRLKARATPPPLPVMDTSEPEPQYLEFAAGLVEIQAALPPEIKTTKD